MPSFSLDVTLAKAATEVGSMRRLGVFTQSNAREFCMALAETFSRIGGGLEPATIAFNLSTSNAVAAWGTLTLSSGSGAVGGTIAGTAKTVTWATSDTASAAALATAINADATLNKIVVATSAAGVVTLTAIDPGVLGNQITLVASGTGVTAGHVASGKFTGGTGSDVAPTIFTRT